MTIYFADGTNIATAPGEGKLKEVLQNYKAATVSSTSSSWADVSGLTKTITVSDSNKVLVLVSCGWGSNSTVYRRLLRGSTVIGGGTTFSNGRNGIGGGYGGNAGGSRGAYYSTCVEGFVYLDDPGNGSHTYKVQWVMEGGSTGYLNRGFYDRESYTGDGYKSRTGSTITVIEVDA